MFIMNNIGEWVWFAFCNLKILHFNLQNVSLNRTARSIVISLKNAKDLINSLGDDKTIGNTQISGKTFGNVPFTLEKGVVT